MSDFEKDYVPSPPAKTKARHVTPDGREAPVLLLTFECPRCRRRTEQDAYKGPVSCSGISRIAHTKTFMTPLVMRPELYHPPFVSQAVGRGGVPQ